MLIVSSSIDFQFRIIQREEEKKNKMNRNSLKKIIKNCKSN